MYLHTFYFIVTCGAEQFQCQSGDCISKDLVNNGEENCSDGSDEELFDYDYDDNVDDGDDLAAIIPSEPTELEIVDMPKFNTLKLKVMGMSL